MNYIILKSIIESTVQNFRCKDCASSISEGNISILGLAGSSVNMEITCPNCRSQGVVKAEIGFVNQHGSPEMLSHLKHQIQNPQSLQSLDSIKDSDILSLRENLKKCNSIEDLFK